MVVVGQLFVARYEVLAKIGEGGMGSVYQVRDIELDSICALKLLSANLLADKENRERFLREGKTMSRIAHKNVARLFRIGVEEGRPYLIMEYLEGDSVRRLLQNQEPLPRGFALELITQVCEGMSAAHEKHIFHRDLKPDNLVVVPIEGSDQFVVKVLDFGLARFKSNEMAKSQHLTQTGALIGSVHYMSPEQCIGQKVDERADIYSLGCVLFECLTGRPPFDANSPIGLLHKHQHEDIPDLIGIDAGESLWLNAVVKKALAKLPDNRYQSMQELRADLIDCSKGRIPEGISQSNKSSDRATGKRKNNVALILILCGVLITVLTLIAPTKREKSAVVFHSASSELRALEGDVARARRALSLTPEKEKAGAGDSLFTKARDLRGQYWKYSMYEQWFGLTASMVESSRYLLNTRSSLVSLFCENYHRCYGLSRRYTDEKQIKLWTMRADQSLRDVDSVIDSFDDSVAEIHGHIAHCMDETRQGNFARARRSYDSAFRILNKMDRNRSVVISFGILNDDKRFQTMTAGEWLDFLIEFPYCHSPADALDLGEMIVPLANFMDAGSEHEISTRSRRYVLATLLAFFPRPPRDSVMRKRYEKLMGDLKAKQKPSP